MATRMQQRRGTASQWISTNSGNGPILSIGEIGFESDTNKFKIGDGVNHWVDLTYFTDADSILASINGLVDGAPELLNTLNEIAAALGDDPTFFTSVATNLANHEADTTSIHGIADTAELATKAFAASLLTGATKTNITITGDKNGLTITAENGVADSTTSDLAEGTNLYFTDERAQDAVGNILTGGLTYNDSTPGIGINYVTLGDTLLDGVSGASYGLIGTSTYLDVKNTNGYNKEIELDIAAVKSQLNTDGYITASSTSTLTNKTLTSPKINEDVVVTATATELNVLDGITSSTAELNILDGATLSTTELNYVDGVTSAIQDQLDDKAPLDAPTFTGLATFDDLEIGGALTFSGTATQIDQTNLTISDPLIYLADGNTGNINDLGFVANYNDGTYKHTGLARDASAGKWKLFDGVTDEPTNTVNFTQGSLDALAVGAFEASSITVGDVSNTEFGYLNGVTSAIQTQLDDKQPKVTGVSDTEIGYLDGVTSAIQTQLDAKIAKSLVDAKGDILVGSADNTVDRLAVGTDGYLLTADAASTNGVKWAAAPVSLPAQSGNNGKYLTTDGSTASWGTVSSYSAPTLGSTSIASGATVTDIAGLTINSTTIPSSKTLVVTTDKLSALAATSSSELAGVISDETGTGALVFGTSPSISDPKISILRNTQTGTTYTLVLTDAGKLVTLNNSSGITLTVPTNASVAFPIGTQIMISAFGSGRVTVSSSATIRSGCGLITRAQYSGAVLTKIDTDEWLLVGDTAVS